MTSAVCDALTCRAVGFFCVRGVASRQNVHDTAFRLAVASQKKLRANRTITVHSKKLTPPRAKPAHIAWIATAVIVSPPAAITRKRQRPSLSGSGLVRARESGCLGMSSGASGGRLAKPESGPALAPMVKRASIRESRQSHAAERFGLGRISRLPALPRETEMTSRL